MTIYIDNDCKCYTAPAVGCVAVETSFFDGKCKAYIEGYRFVPEGRAWTRRDGKVFHGETAFPWKDHAMLVEMQKSYEENLAELTDMQSALELLGAEPTEV